MHTYQNLSKYTKIWLRVKDPCAHLLTQKQLASIMGFITPMGLWSINVNHVMMPTDSKIPNDAKFECLQTAPVRLPAVQPANAVLLVCVLRDMSSYLSPATEVAAVPSYLWFIKSAMDVLRCKMIIIYLHDIDCHAFAHHSTTLSRSKFKAHPTSTWRKQQTFDIARCKAAC